MPTAVGQLRPNAIDAGQDSLATEAALGADLLGQICDLTGEVLKLVHHGVDGALESRNFGVHLLGVNQNLFAEITMCDGRDNATNFSKGLLEGQICLLMFLQLSLESSNVLDAMAEGLVLVPELPGNLGAEAVYVLSLALDLLGLLVQVVAQVSELVLGQLRRGHRPLARRLFLLQPVCNP